MIRRSNSTKSDTQTTSDINVFVLEPQVSENGVATKIVYPPKPSVLQLNCRCPLVPALRKTLSLIQTYKGRLSRHVD